MSGRSESAQAFLDRIGWGQANRAVLAGDASARRYDRLILPDGTRAVLMDADPARGEDVRPFVAIATHLRGIGLSAPEVIAADPDAGFLLLEDLGDAIFARETERDPGLEMRLYEGAVDVLCVVQQHPAPSLRRLDAAASADLAALVFEWYRPGDSARNAALAETFRARFQEICAPLDDTPPVLMLRDYHAENLIWLPKRKGHARVGLLDFQDAMLAHPAYDLVSVLQDARRDVSADVTDAAIARFIDRTGAEPEAFRAACAILGLQRQLRILGIFARLARRDGKTRYLDFLPRIWGHVQRNLDHPALSDIAAFLHQNLPPPDTEHIAALSRPCLTVPTP
ncbi:phosphotransferase [Sulfitobacter sp. LCG007]